MLIVPQKNFVFINKEVSTFKKCWMFLQILFNTLAQLQIKEKIQEDKGPLMELSTCQQNFTLGKKTHNYPNNHHHQTTFQHVQPNIHNSQSQHLLVHHEKKALKPKQTQVQDSCQKLSDLYKLYHYSKNTKQTKTPQTNKHHHFYKCLNYSRSHLAMRKSFTDYNKFRAFPKHRGMHICIFCLRAPRENRARWSRHLIERCWGNHRV